jgi:hypothetical protein
MRDLGASDHQRVDLKREMPPTRDFRKNSEAAKMLPPSGTCAHMGPTGTVVRDQVSAAATAMLT